MKAFRNLLLVLGLTAGVFGAAQALAEERGVVAMVNDEPIGASALQRGVDAVLRAQGLEIGAIRNPDQLNLVRSQVLDQLIAQRLLWQEAKAKKITADKEAVDEVIKRIRSNLPGATEFQEKLEEAGMTEAQYRQDLRERLSVRMLVRDDITKDIEISDDEISDYYEQNQDRFRQPVEVRARHILIKVSPDADEETVGKAETEIKAILDKAVAEGTDFAELATETSQGPSASKGGDLGFLRQEQLVKPFADVAFSLEPGDIAGPVRTQFGFHVIKMEERRGGDLVAEEEAAPQIKEYLFALRSRQLIQDRVKRLRDSGKVVISGL